MYMYGIHLRFPQFWLLMTLGQAETLEAFKDGATLAKIVGFVKIVFDIT